MIADHEHMAGALREAAKASGLEPPRPHLGGDQVRFLASLQSLRSHEFDREYGRQQMLAHTSALTMMRSYAEKGSDSNLRRIATSSAPIIERHLQSAQQLLQSIG
jgi:putative membrane protein